MLEMYLKISLYLRENTTSSLERPFIEFFFLLALQPPSEVVFYSPLVGFSLLACEVS